MRRAPGSIPARDVRAAGSARARQRKRPTRGRVPVRVDVVQRWGAECRIWPNWYGIICMAIRNTFPLSQPFRAIVQQTTPAGLVSSCTCRHRERVRGAGRHRVNDGNPPRPGKQCAMNSDIPEFPSTQHSQAAYPPSGLPEHWRPLLACLTDPESENTWGLRAAIVIAHHRKVHHYGPSFAELFSALGIATMPPSKDAAEVNAKTARLQTYEFRGHVANHWRRLGWIQWTHRPRSLRTGKAFSASSKAWNAGRKTRAISADQLPDSSSRFTTF